MAVGLVERIDDALNPIVVKELRQAVQSRFVVVALLIELQQHGPSPPDTLHFADLARPHSSCVNRAPGCVKRTVTEPLSGHLPEVGA